MCFKIPIPVTLVLALLVLCAGVSRAQVTTATFHAIVTDPSDALVANATVTLRKQRTGAGSEKVTDPSGECAFTFVPIGLSIKATGFKTVTVSGLTPDAGQNVRRCVGDRRGRRKSGCHKQRW